MDLVFVGDRCNDHSPSSGYDQLCSLFPEAGWLSGRALADGRETWYRRPTDGPVASRGVFHVFYGDCSGRSLPEILRCRFPDATVVCSLHQPVSRLIRDPEALASIRHADALITVSREQARQLGALKLSIPVDVIPHGVWTDTFHPTSNLRGAQRDRVLLVGNYLRDWGSASRIARMLAHVGVHCLVIGSNAPGDPFLGNAFVSQAPRLSESELASVYESSAALLMPVIDATASNALLEAMAAGCPVVCTQKPTLVDEYLGDRSDSFEDGDDDTAVSRLLRYVRKPQDRARRSRVLVRRARRFDWSNLRERYAQAYEELLARAR